MISDLENLPPIHVLLAKSEKGQTFSVNAFSASSKNSREAQIHHANTDTSKTVTVFEKLFKSVWISVAGVNIILVCIQVCVCVYPITPFNTWILTRAAFSSPAVDDSSELCFSPKLLAGPSCCQSLYLALPSPLPGISLSGLKALMKMSLIQAWT